MQRLLAALRRSFVRTPAAHTSRSRQARTSRLEILPLEQRALPSATAASVAPNQVFLATAYQTLLNRPADPAGLTFWGGQLAGRFR